MMKSYAQNFEDVLLWRALRDITNGFYVDLGAQHPTLDSVSRWFYDQGWRGVHVEPVPYYANLLRHDRRGDDVIEAVISDEPGEHMIYVFPDTGLSTMSLEIAETHKTQLGREWQECAVSSLSLSDVFTRHRNREVHWLKVDVEGHERSALSSWRSNPVRPWIVLVEATYPNSQIEMHNEWEGLLTSRGYAFVYADGLNRYYLHEEHEDLRDRFRYPPNYFDHFSLDKHWATEQLRNQNHQALEEALNQRRRAEEEKAQASIQWEERDARVSATIVNHLSGEMAAFSTQMARAQEALEARLLELQNGQEARVSAAIGGHVSGEMAGLSARVLRGQEALEARLVDVQEDRQAGLSAAIANHVSEETTRLAERVARGQEMLESRLLEAQEERDARVSTAIADAVNGEIAGLASRVSHAQESLEMRLTNAQELLNAERTSDRALLFHQISTVKDLVEANVAGFDGALHATNEVLNRLVDQLASDRLHLSTQMTDLAANIRDIEQSLHATKSSRWEALRTLLRPSQGGLLVSSRVSRSPPVCGKSQISSDVVTNPVQGSDSLTDDKILDVATLGELYALAPADFIKVSYRALLDREADRRGVLHYLGRMALGDSRSKIHQSIIKSEEYHALATCSDFAGLDNDAFVEAAYQRILRRAPDGAGRAHYMEQLRRGKSRADISRSLARSEEAQTSGQPLLCLRREIQASLNKRWRTLGPGQSARRLAQLDFTLSTAIQRIEADLQRELGELRISALARQHGASTNSVDANAEKNSLGRPAVARPDRPRWVPRNSRAKAASSAIAPKQQFTSTHTDYQDLVQRMRQEAPFGRLQDQNEGRQFGDYLENEFAPENHDGDTVCWMGHEATVYLHVSGPHLNVEAAGFFEDRSLLVLFDGVVVGTMQFGKERVTASLLVSKWVGKNVAIRLKCSGVFNPAAAGFNTDQRDLGLLIRSIYFN